MPIYVYKHRELKDEIHCDIEIEALQALGAPNLVQCPKCNKSIERSITAPNIVSTSSRQIISKAKAGGFKAFKRRDKGKYEAL